MKYIPAIATFALVCMVSSCKKDDTAKNTPACIRNEIKSHDDTWLVSKVDEYSFQGKTVYVFEPDSRMRDASAAIWDDHCNFLCSVGGYGGPNLLLCNGVRFYENATYLRTIWKR